MNDSRVNIHLNQDILLHLVEIFIGPSTLGER